MRLPADSLWKAPCSDGERFRAMRSFIGMVLLASLHEGDRWEGKDRPTGMLCADGLIRDDHVDGDESGKPAMF